MTILRLTIILGTMLGVLFLSVTAYGEDRYIYRERGKNRMEGIKDVPRASLDLRIVSFLGYREDFIFAPDDDIKVKFYVPSSEPLFITASEVIPVHNYFMKPLKKQWPMGWQLFSGWPASEVLIPKEITPQQLGLVGRLNRDKPGSGKLVPLLFYVGEDTEQITSYEVRLVSRETLTKFEYKLRRMDVNQQFLHKVLRKEFPAGTPILITLNVEDQPAGSFELSVKGKVKGLNEGPKRTYLFYHKPGVTR